MSSPPSLRALQLWDAMIEPQANKWKRRGNACKSCTVEFIPHPDNPDADMCGLCKARKKEFDAMLQCLTLRVAK
jgi:hypothetical protein